jgi:hypothetical protein
MMRNWNVKWNISSFASCDLYVKDTDIVLSIAIITGGRDIDHWSKLIFLLWLSREYFIGKSDIFLKQLKTVSGRLDFFDYLVFHFLKRFVMIGIIGSGRRQNPSNIDCTVSLSIITLLSLNQVKMLIYLFSESSVFLGTFYWSRYVGPICH